MLRDQSDIGKHEVCVVDVKMPNKSKGKKANSVTASNKLILSDVFVSLWDYSSHFSSMQIHLEHVLVPEILELRQRQKDIRRQEKGCWVNKCSFLHDLLIYGFFSSAEPVRKINQKMHVQWCMFPVINSTVSYKSCRFDLETSMT